MHMAESKLVKTARKLLQKLNHMSSPLSQVVIVTYLIAVIALINSIVMVNNYGLSDRGSFAAFILYATLVGGLAVAFYEGSLFSGSVSLRVLWSIPLVSFFILYIVESSIRDSDKSEIIALSFIMLVELGNGLMVLHLLRSNTLAYNLCRASHPAFFLCLNIMFFETKSQLNPLVVNYFLANILTLVTGILLLFKLRGRWPQHRPGYVEKNNVESRVPGVGSFLYLARPAIMNLDKIMLERVLGSASFGAYVTISSIINIGSPVLNAIQQLGFHKIIPFFKSKNFIKVWFFSMGFGVAAVIIFDVLFYGLRLKPFYYFLPLLILFSCAHHLTKYAENILIHSRKTLAIAVAKTLLLFVVGLILFAIPISMSMIFGVVLFYFFTAWLVDYFGAIYRSASIKETARL